MAKDDIIDRFEYGFEKALEHISDTLKGEEAPCDTLKNLYEDLKKYNDDE